MKARILTTVALALAACAAAPHVVRHRAQPRKLGARMGVSFGTNDAGMPVDDAGGVVLPLDAGVPAVLGNPAVDHCVVTSVSINPPDGTFLARVVCGPYPFAVAGTLDHAQLTAVYNLVRAAAADGGIQ